MTSISTQSATPMSEGFKFDGLTDQNRHEIDWVEFNSPVWTGRGCSNGISVRQAEDVPSDRARCDFAEIVEQNWRFVFNGFGAVLVSASNIKFIWTLAPVPAAKAEYNMREALSHIAGNLVKRDSGDAPEPDATPEPIPEPLPIPEPVAQPDPTADFAVADSVPTQTEQPVKRKRGRPRKNPLPETPAT